MNDTILDVQGLTIEFATADRDASSEGPGEERGEERGEGRRSIVAVDDVSFQLQRGQTLGIVGESGSGKSVTALAIIGLVPSPPGEVTGGRVIFQPDDRPLIDLRQVSKRKMRQYRGGQIAMIFQEPMSSLNPVYTCGFQLIEAIRQHQKVSKQQAQEMAIAQLQEVQLLPPEVKHFEEIRAEINSEDTSLISREVKKRQKAMLERFPHQMSGGQIQRLMIAMALSSNPSLLIADEPTTALDVTVQSTILDLLRELRDRRGMSMIFITHDLGIIAEIADRVAVMYRGKIVETGSVLDMFEQPSHPYTRGLLACRPQPAQRLRQLPTVADYMEIVTSPEGEPMIVAKPQDDFGAGLPPVTEISPREMQIRLEALQDKGPLLTVENLKVGYPV
ncbi:MAG: ABC transporter ATP-binding protein, partial [Phormidesmis sp.]